jgi:hypothetical protein
MITVLDAIAMLTGSLTTGRARFHLCWSCAAMSSLVSSPKPAETRSRFPPKTSNRLRLLVI